MTRVAGLASNTLRAGAVAMALAGCGGNLTLDAGSDHPHGLLPIDERNPTILCNDGPHDNWQGEYAMLLASTGHLTLVGIIVDQTRIYPDIDDNVAGWRTMTKAARDSGLRNIPDPIASIGATLKRPANDDIDSTEPNRSEGAQLIINLAEELARPLRPLVVAAGGPLTDIADAYLMDHSVTDRVVVVASVGKTSADGVADLGAPNGDTDSWATEIVARRYRYVQVNAYYAQKDDVPASRVSELPANELGDWMSSKVGKILEPKEAADQNSVIAVAFPHFALQVNRGALAGDEPTPAGQVAKVDFSSPGNVWVVPRGDNAASTAWFWDTLKNPATFSR